MTLSYALRAAATELRALLLLAGLAIAGPAVAVPIELTVMTQNLYLGADTSGILGAPNAAAIPGAVKAAFLQAKANEFNLRVEGIADDEHYDLQPGFRADPRCRARFARPQLRSRRDA
jgi:hypothetical protein